LKVSKVDFDFERHLLSHAYAAGKKFLLYGTMLRKPKTAKISYIPVNWHRGYSKRHWKIKLPVVMHSAWRAPDGSLGLVFYNITNKPQKITTFLNHPDLKITTGQHYSVKTLYPTALKQYKLNTITGKTPTFSCTVPPRSPVVIEIKNI
jgi:hypothetical protein